MRGIRIKMDEYEERITSKREQKLLRAKYRKLTRRYKRGCMKDIIYAHRVFELVRQGLDLSQDRMEEISLLDSNFVVQRREGNMTIETYYRHTYPNGLNFNKAYEEER